MLKVQSTGKGYALGKDYEVNLSDDLTEALENLIGEENVVAR